MSSNQTLSDYCKRLGLAGDAAFLRLAGDSLRRVAASRTAATLKLSSSCQAVAALHLAAERSGDGGRGVPTTDAVKLSGLRRDKYQNLMENLRKELGLGKADPSLEEVAVGLGCPQVRAAAARCLARFREATESALGSSARGNVSLDKPVYACAAVAAACGLAKPRVRVDRARLLEMSGARKKELDALVKTMAEAAAAGDGPKEAADKEGGGGDVAMDIDKRSSSQSPRKRASAQRPSRANDEDEGLAFDMSDYQEWKAKILKEAGIAA